MGKWSTADLPADLTADLTADLAANIKDAPKYKPFNEEISKELKDAEKENNFIYHDPVPTKDKLDAIKPAVVAKPTSHDRNKLLLGAKGGDLFEAVVPLQGKIVIQQSAAWYIILSTRS